MRLIERYGLLVLVFAVAAFLATYLVLESLEGIQREESLAVMNEVSSRLQVGLVRNQVEQQISNYERRYRCRLKDIYLFGSQDPEVAAILYLHYESVDGVEILDQIATLDSHLLAQHADCEADDSSP